MNKLLPLLTYIYLFGLVFFNHSWSQNAAENSDLLTPLFRNEEILPVKMSYSIKEFRKNTDDSTYMNTAIAYLEEDGNWKELGTMIRTRGEFRLNNCYFPPVKMKIESAESKGTLFEGNKKLKLTVQCSAKKGTYDYVLKEFIAYKMYEHISPYHYKARLADINFDEIKGGQTRNHAFKGFFVEDLEKIAERFGGDPIDRIMHPMAQDPLSSVRNAFFQFLIGNTDFSTYVLHNEKLLYIDKKVIPVPYDFDMSGFVDTGYATVSHANDEPLPISSVRDRLYRGFRRDPAIIAQVRKEFIDNKAAIIGELELQETLFENPKQYEKAKSYVEEFFKIMEDDKLYKKEITDRLRNR